MAAAATKKPDARKRDRRAYERTPERRAARAAIESRRYRVARELRRRLRALDEQTLGKAAATLGKRDRGILEAFVVGGIAGYRRKRCASRCDAATVSRARGVQRMLRRLTEARRQALLAALPPEVQSVVIALVLGHDLDTCRAPES
jgi:hypothetical protein